MIHGHVERNYPRINFVLTVFIEVAGKTKINKIQLHQDAPFSNYSVEEFRTLKLGRIKERIKKKMPKLDTTKFYRYSSII